MSFLYVNNSQSDSLWGAFVKNIPKYENKNKANLFQKTSMKDINKTYKWKDIYHLKDEKIL